MKQARRKQASEHKTSIDLTDQARDCCLNIATLAALLENCRSQAGVVIKGDATVTNSGTMIAKEAAKLRSLVDALDQSIAGNSRKL